MTTAVSPELLARHDQPLPRYTSYPPTPLWQEFGAADYRAALQALASRPGDPVAVYLHLPFCVTRCYYCGCHAIGTPRTDLQDPYLQRVEREIDLVTAQLPERRSVNQLHWGGGTPNYLTAPQLERAMELFQTRFRIAPDAEISIEADPRVTSPEQLTLLRRLGFNRLSLGIQDLDPAVQEAIGRIQPESQVRRVYQAARTAGFEGVNFDLVYGLPEQTPATFARTLETVLELGPDRVACFGYAHVPWARPNQRRIATDSLPDRDERFALFRQAVDAFTSAGYLWLGMDHFARPDDELARAFREGRLQRNFMGYTVSPAPHMLGFGVSAIGEVAGYYIQNEPQLGGWQRAVDRGDLPVVRGHQLTADDQLRRAAIMRLLSQLELPLAMLPPAADPLAPLMPSLDEGLVRVEGDRIVVTELGRWFLRSVCAALDAGLPREPGAPRYSRSV